MQRARVQSSTVVSATVGSGASWLVWPRVLLSPICATMVALPAPLTLLPLRAPLWRPRGLIRTGASPGDGPTGLGEDGSLIGGLGLADTPTRQLGHLGRLSLESNLVSLLGRLTGMQQILMEFHKNLRD